MTYLLFTQYIFTPAAGKEPSFSWRILSCGRNPPRKGNYLSAEGYKGFLLTTAQLP
jgi:hypothetical protein